ncbi:helicase-related protein, partial [Sulfitobacter sp. HI0129]
EVARQATTGENIEQGVLMFKGSRKDREASEKRKVLRALIDAEGDKCTNAIIFCNRKMDVDVVAKSLKKYGYDAAPIHGDLDQSQRTRTLEGFRAGDLRFLVASDVAARGLDVPSVSHVFNFDVPSHAEDYVHRIGRTGRAGRDGKAIMICVPRDEKNLADVERLVQREIPRLENPLGGETAPEASQPTDDKPAEKPKRSRSRSRKSDDKAPRDAQKDNDAKGRTQEPKGDSKSADGKDSKPQQDDAADKRQRQPRKADQQDRRTEDRNRDDDRGGRGGNRGGRNSDRGGNKVVGLGDHTPAFIELSFEDRRDN